MTSERMKRLHELFDAALALEPTARAAFLLRQNIDDSLRAEVESLLAAHERTDETFLRPETQAGNVFRAGIAAALADHDAQGASGPVRGDAATPAHAGEKGERPHGAAAGAHDPGEPAGSSLAPQAAGDADPGQPAEGGRATCHARGAQGAQDGRDIRHEPPFSHNPLIGRTIGRYLIKSVIASGGMGTVYKAVQDNPRRTVALKVMHTASPSAVRRFQLEAQVLGRLQHPNIAHVYEAGTHELEGEAGALGGRHVPFFAMELVEDARSITDYAAARRLGQRERLTLFLKVCDAVQHGHQKGIIHRDLKPANILVCAAGEPKVIDFGVARATDADLAVTTQTSAGDLIGTVQYMSPEQCDGDAHNLDTRSDVYSLGVVLYELLTGTLPYNTGNTSIYHAVRTIREAEPRRPSTLRRKRRRAGDGGPAARHGGTALRDVHPMPERAPEDRVTAEERDAVEVTPIRGDLETIILKTLEKNRERRYASVADLARDIRHFLNGEPIEARSATVWTRTMRWAIRNPVVTTTLACGAVALAFISGVWVVNRFYWAQPDRFIWSDDRSTVRLMSRAGTILREWDAGSDRYVRFADLVQRPSDRKLLALIGMPRDARTPDFEGKLLAFDVRSSKKSPLWAAEVTDANLLQPEFDQRGFRASGFGVSSALIADVFQEQDGPEITVVFDHDWSRRLVQVYSLSGQVLFSFWHDGSLARPVWWAKPRLLVFSASDDRVNWAGDQPRSEKSNPHILLAVRPSFGAHLHDYILYPVGGDPVIQPEWCVRLQPERLDVVSFNFEERIAARPGTEDEEVLEWSFTRSHNGSSRQYKSWSFFLQLDPRGQIVPDGVRTGEWYKAALKAKDLGEETPPDPKELGVIAWPTDEARRIVRGER